jgi:LysM repeat protein
MKTYTSKPNDSLGSIARKFGMPSWKYLYQLNKDKIGDNPDLLAEGTVLKIPEWDSTGGDEILKEMGVDPSDWTGGLRYKYPWVPFSISLTDNDKKLLLDFDEEREWVICNRKTGKIIKKGTIKNADQVETLSIDHEDVMFGIKGFPLLIDGKEHVHPDDYAKNEEHGEAAQGEDAVQSSEEDTL